MKLTLFLIVLLIATVAITKGEEEHFDASSSNNTLESNSSITSPGISKNSTDLYRIPSTIIDETNYSTTEEENSTVEELHKQNVTQESSAITTAQEVDLNDTMLESNSTAHPEEVEAKNITGTMTEDNTTSEESAISSIIEEKTLDESINTTKGPSALETIHTEGNDAAITENITITGKEEADLNISATTELPGAIKDHKSHCKPYVQKLLTTVFSKHADKLDPLILQVRKIEFETHFLLGSEGGVVKLYDGRVIGLSRSKSVHECSTQQQDDQVTIQSIISFEEVELAYKGRVSFMNILPEISVGGILGGVFVELQVAVPGNGGVGEIKQLHVKTTGAIQFDLKGLGPIEWALDFIIEAIEEAFLLDFRKSIEKELKNAMEEEIKAITYP